MFNWVRKKQAEIDGKIESKTQDSSKERKGMYSTHFPAQNFKHQIQDALRVMRDSFPKAESIGAMDDSSNGYPDFKTYASGSNTVNDALIFWYVSQGFIGHQLCGVLSQNWLINKACSMPAEDAIRKGYAVTVENGDALDKADAALIKRYDMKYGIKSHMRDFIRKGRIFGVRIAMFKVESTDKDYYEKPFNLDGIAPNTYKGIVQIDPYWTAPLLDQDASSRPDSLHFYEPTWWMINGKKIHRTHLIIFRHAEPVDVLKPQYIYGGIPLSQQIMERIYAAERTANEAPQLAMTKRTTIWQTNAEDFTANFAQSSERMYQWSQMRDNYGIKIGDKEADQFSQFDTSLADMDALIMTQYQLVAAIACVPATKLLGTSPKGFGASGEYEESSYHELLESIQNNDLTPLLERHHQLVLRSFSSNKDIQTSINWLPLDTPTAKELADTNAVKAQIDATLVGAGVISSEDARQRLATDKTSGYNELGTLDDEDLDDSDLFEASNDAMDDRFITVHPNGKEHKGNPVLIGENGEIKGGMGGKFNGTKLHDLKSKSNNLSKPSEETYKEKKSREASEEANAAGNKAKTWVDHNHAFYKHVEAHISANNAGNKELASYHESEAIKHHSLFKKLKIEDENQAKKEKKALEKEKKEQFYKTEYANDSPEEINEKLTSKYGLSFTNHDKYFPPQRHNNIDINKNGKKSRDAREIISAVDSSLSLLKNAGYDIKSELSKHKVSFVAGRPTRSDVFGHAWQDTKNDIGLFALDSKKICDDEYFKEEQRNAQIRKEKGKPLWSIGSGKGKDEIIRAASIHELAHALGMRPTKQSPLRLHDIITKLFPEPKERANWIANNVSEYALTNVKELDAELAALVTSPDYQRGSLPKELEDHVDWLFNKVK